MIKVSGITLTSTIILSFIISIMIIGHADAERFFQQHNTWYEKIPQDAAITENSSQYVADIISNANWWYAAEGEYSTPIFYALGGESNITVNVTHPTQSINDHIVNSGWNVVPMPSGAIPAGNDAYCTGSYRDGHMVVISSDKTTAWDFYQAKKCGTNPWTAKSIKKWDLQKDGIQPEQGDFLIGDSAVHISLKAASIALSHGIITYDEVVNDGVIDHALQFVYYGEYYPVHEAVYPARGWRNGHPTITDRPYALHAGMRLQLNPSYDCSQHHDPNDTYNLNEMICVALQDYGMIFVDTTSPGNNYVFLEYLEDVPGKSWDGIKKGHFPMPLSELRVIEPLIIESDPSFNFALANSGNVSVTQGASNNTLINASLTSGTSETVTFSVNGLPDGVTASFSSGSCSPACSTTLTLEATAETSLGTNSITVTGTGGGLVRTTSLEISVIDSNSQNSIEALNTLTPISIDGILSEASWNDSNSVTFQNGLISDNQVTVSTLWDDDYLYFAYEVTDSTIEALTNSVWSDDGIELFLDIANNKASSMDADDYKFLASINNIVSGGAIQARTATNHTGYSMEVAVPWSTIDTTPSDGKTMGILFTNDDVDNGNINSYDWLDLIATGHFARPDLWGSLIISNQEAGTLDLTPPSPPTWK